jgi:hypothetical protein
VREIVDIACVRDVFSSGDLVEDLTHNFLETGARNNKYALTPHEV